MKRLLAALTVAACLPASACGSAGDTSRPAGARAAVADPTRTFLQRYVDRNGRVVRRDQGGDTVSEGQAYALLLSVARGDRARFARVWRWTRTHLQRDDGLLSWHWRDGRVVDPQPASDADLDAARALTLAARRFARPAYGRAARRIVRGLRRHVIAGGTFLAGPWARGERWTNPSYVSPRAARTLHLTAADGRGARRFMAPGRLPPDWTRGGRPVGAPGSNLPPRYGYDAVRVPVRLAESCRRVDRRAAARLWPILARDAGRLPRALEGPPVPQADLHPVALVGAAGAAHAAGARADARHLLDLAVRRDRAQPTYYGAAWAALGREMLLTRRLGRCG